MTNTCEHTGDHLLCWNASLGGSSRTVADYVRVAMNHVSEDDVEPGDLDIVGLLLDRAEHLFEERRLDRRPSEGSAYMIPVSPEDLAVAERVLFEACQYMTINNYAADEDFPEDAAAARGLGSAGQPALVCWVDAYARRVQSGL